MVDLATPFYDSWRSHAAGMLPNGTECNQWQRMQNIFSPEFPDSVVNARSLQDVLDAFLPRSMQNPVLDVYGDLYAICLRAVCMIVLRFAVAGAYTKGCEHLPSVLKALFSPLFSGKKWGGTSHKQRHSLYENLWYCAMHTMS